MQITINILSSYDIINYAKNKYNNLPSIADISSYGLYLYMKMYFLYLYVFYNEILLSKQTQMKIILNESSNLLLNMADSMNNQYILENEKYSIKLDNDKVLYKIKYDNTNIKYTPINNTTNIKYTKISSNPQYTYLSNKNSKLLQLSNINDIDNCNCKHESVQSDIGYSEIINFNTSNKNNIHLPLFRLSNNLHSEINGCDDTNSNTNNNELYIYNPVIDVSLSKS